MRLQLALDVSDLDESIDFYTKMFGVGPAKTRPGYANFEIHEPPLKLVLFEAATGGTINHLGVETDSAQQVTDAEARISGAGFETTGVDDSVCCFAAKTETWVDGPDGTKWEWYVKNADSDAPEAAVIAVDGESACCG